MRLLLKVDILGMNLSHFIRQKSYEKILHRIRRHPITFFSIFLFFIVLVLLPLAVFYVLGPQISVWTEKDAAFVALTLLGSAYFVGIILFFYSNFIDFYLDTLIVTNDRLIDMEQNGLFSRTIAEVDLYQIQDVTSEVNGFFATMFKYGNLIIQTAGSVPKFVVHNIHNPHHLRQELLHLAEEDRKYHNK